MGFVRNKEDFICAHCGKSVQGNGYTNHCPQCLRSRHVDIDPGDRLSRCGGMMKPISVERKGDAWILTHSCETCGHEKRNEMAPSDNFDAAVAIVKPA